MAKAKKTNKGKIAAEIGAGLLAAGAAAAAGYYLYGSKNAKKHRKTAAKEIKAGWKIAQREVQKASAEGKKTVKKVVKKVRAKTRKSR